MFKNQFKILYRNLFRNKKHSLINIIGFAIGITSFVLILLYAHHELTIDSFHEKNEQVHKLTLGEEFSTMAPLSNILKDEIPEIEKITRIDFNIGGGISPVLEVNQAEQLKKIRANNIIYADSAFFDIFSFEVISGNLKKALTEEKSIVLTESLAQILFEDENAIGKNIKFIGTNEYPKLDYTVTAIIKDVPENSSIKFSGIVSYSTLNIIKPGGMEADNDYGNWTYDTYALINENISIKNLTEKVNSVWLDHILNLRNINPDSQVAKEYIVGFVPLGKVSFYKNNKIKFIYLILIVGIIIIAMAIVNFVNLNIANASLRSKEIGVKKVIGSGKFMLIKQFMGESFLLTFVSTIIALILAICLMPVFEQITGIYMSFKITQIPILIFTIFFGTLLIGIFAGIYPSLYLSAIKPLVLFKNNRSSNKKHGIIRSLVIFQFAASVILIVSTLFIMKQIKFMRTGDVGFDNNNVIVCKQPLDLRNKYNAFKQKLLQNPNILHITSSQDEGLSQPFHMSFTNEINGIEKTFYAMEVDPDFIKTIGLEVIEGRDFSWEFADEYKRVIVNETTVKNFGLKEPLGTLIDMLGYKMEVVGVVKDFHNESFQEQVKPLVLWCVPGHSNTMSMRISGTNIPQTIKYINKQWDEFSPDIPFEYHFLDEKYDALYKSEDRFAMVISSFSVIAVLIACLGLLGVVSLLTEKRTKEIGIRKVNGANLAEVLLMLNIDFIKWIFIALIIATPIACFTMNKWLQNFAYKTEMSWWIFALAGVIALIIALVTVSWQSWRAASRNPVEALRYE